MDIKSPLDRCYCSVKAVEYILFIGILDQYKILSACMNISPLRIMLSCFDTFGIVLCILQYIFVLIYCPFPNLQQLAPDRVKMEEPAQLLTLAPVMWVGLKRSVKQVRFMCQNADIQYNAQETSIYLTKKIPKKNKGQHTLTLRYTPTPLSIRLAGSTV